MAAAFMLSSHELFGFMPPTLANHILEFVHDNDRDLYRLTLNSIAEAKKVRSVFLERKPKVDRHKDMISMLGKPRVELIAGSLLRGWLLKKNKAMLVAFLDALGIKHEEGVVEDLPETVEEEKVRAAVDKLLAEFPREEVIVYLNAFYAMNEVNWPNLKIMLENDSRLQFV
jgi:hypothetical protein